MFFQLSRCYRVVERFIINSVHTMVKNQNSHKKCQLLWRGKRNVVFNMNFEKFIQTRNFFWRNCLVRLSVLYIKKGETRPLKAKAFFGTHAGTVTVHRTVTILRIALFDSLFFASKRKYQKWYFLFGAEGETRTLAPVTRPTPLAGAPRHQLEYFCKLTGWTCQVLCTSRACYTLS